MTEQFPVDEEIVNQGVHDSEVEASLVPELDAPEQMMEVMDAPTPSTIEPELEPEDYKDEIGALAKELLQEDKENRYTDLRICLRNNRYWLNQTDIAWDSSKGIWEAIPESDAPRDVTDKSIAIYRTYGMAIVAALSTGVPILRYYPKNADSANDIITSKTFSTISELIDKDNDAQALITRVLVTLWNEQYAAAYTYFDHRDEFGTEKVDVYSDVEVQHLEERCPACGNILREITLQQDEQPPMPSEQACERCAQTIQSQIIPVGTSVQQQVTGQQEVPKGRQIIEVYGTAEVSIPRHARKLSECHYLRLSKEIHYSEAREMYPDAEINPGTILETESRDARVDPIFFEDIDRRVVTHSYLWLRPYAFNTKDKEQSANFKERYPKGCRLHYINDQVVAIDDDTMDEHWEISVDPTSKTLTAEPYGNSIIDIQDSYNDTFAIGMRTLLYGVPELFADPNVLNFKAFGEKKVTPGEVTPAKAKAGMPLAAGFFATRSTTLPKELPEFAAKILDMGQLLSRAYPSIYGGPSQGNTKTAAEYEQSRQAALQGLAPLWRIVNSLWAGIKDKATRSFRKNMAKDKDINFVVTDGAEGFVNKWIKYSEAQGEIGEVAPESSEQFPTTWAQKRSIILELMNTKDPNIMGILGHPANVELVSQFIGLPELYIPGEDDRIVQLKEIQLMQKQQPDPTNPQMAVAPSLPINPYDNNEVHSAIVKGWLNSSYGQEIKNTAPDVFNAVMQHGQMHDQVIQQQMARQQANQESQMKSPQGAQNESNNAGRNQ